MGWARVIPGTLPTVQASGHCTLCGPHSHTLTKLMGYSDTQTTPDTNSVAALDVCYHSCVKCFSVFAPETEIAANLLSPEQHRAPAARN